MRSRFDKQLEELNHQLTVMGALCENAIALAAKALLTGSMQLAAQLPELAAQITDQERDVERLCLQLLLQQQPVARDLRTVSAALKMITDMERIGVQSADIAEIITMAHIDPGSGMDTIREMAAAATKMVTDSIDAFVARDAAIARAVVAYDDVVDDCFDRIKQALILRFSQPDADGEQTLDLLMIAKYFERIGDHAVNIAQWVLFSITGSREG